MTERLAYKELEKRIKELEKADAERKRAEKELRESERRLSMALEGADEGLWNYYPQTGETYFSPRWYTMLDYEADEFPHIFKSWTELLHPEDRPHAEKRVLNFLENHEEQYSIEFRMRTRGGGWRWILSRGKAIEWDAHGNITRMVGTHIDITNRKKVEEALSKSEAEYRSTVNHLLVGVVVHASDTHILMSNPAATNILGLTAGQMSGKEAIDPTWNFVHEDSTKMKVEDYPVNKVISTKMPLYDYVLGINRPDRDYVTWVNVNAVSIFTNDGELEKVIVNFADITERKRAEADLKSYHEHLEQLVGERTNELRSANKKLEQEIAERKQAEEALKSEMDKLKALLDGLASTKIGVDIVSIDYEILQQNQILTEQFGDIVGKKCYKEYMALEEPCSFCPMIKSLRNKRLERVELQASDGRDYELLSAPLMNTDGTVDRAIEVVLDITDRKQSERELLFKEDIIRSSSSIIATCDLEGNMTYGNPSFLKAWGFEDSEDFLGRHFSEFWEIKDRLDEIMEVLQTEGKWFYEIQARKKDGTPFDVQVSAAMVYDVEGNPIALTSSSIDITERKQAEETLKKKTHDIGERVKELSCFYGISKLIERPDIKLEEIIQGTMNLIPPSWQYPEITCGRISLEGGEYLTKYFQETSWKQTQDIIVYGETIGSIEVYYLQEKPEIDEGPFLKEERNLIDAIAERLGRVSERKRAEEALRQSENLFISQFELGNIGMALTAPDKEWVKINKRLSQMLGYSKEELMKMNWAEMTYPEDLQKDVAQFERVLAGEIDGYELDKRFTRRDGEIIFIHLTVGCIRNSDNSVKYIIASLQDISDRKQAEETLLREKEKLQDALAEIKTLSGMLPICASCKKIRDDKGYWNQIEGYIERHSDASFSHGLCPQCMDKLYGDEDWYKKEDFDK